MTAPTSRRLAIFDLDGTLTRADTLRLYVLAALERHPWQALRLLRLLPALARYVSGSIGRGELKAQLLRVMLGDRTHAELEACTALFVPRLLERGLHRDARERLEAHRQAGDVLILLSASPDLYVPRIGEQLGFHEVLCTGLDWGGEHLTGGLTTPNRRGTEKTHCLEALRARYPGHSSIAYGNAASDLDHLSRVDEGVLVNGSRRARSRAARLGIRCVSWV
ncbi:MAG TPA: HAD family hydrolase [Steroidobacteraceae bacterium]|nr:HAD family hydrolase [Steroidobacteraceae bacterium]